MNPPEIGISIPVWDSSEHQSTLTQNIVRQILSFTGPFHLCVVDNGSPNPKTLEFLKGVQDERFSFQHASENLGVSKGYNLGLLEAYQLGCQFFVCMNNDIILQAADWLERLIAPIRANPKLVTGPRLINYNLNVNQNGRVFEYLEGFLFAMSRECLDTVGLLNEQFSPAYVEDVEYCWRAAKHGFALKEVSVPHHHIYGQTGYISLGDEKRIPITLSNIAKFYRKVDTNDFGKVWYP